jgi:hypothetical protein
MNPFIVRAPSADAKATETRHPLGLVDPHRVLSGTSRDTSWDAIDNGLRRSSFLSRYRFLSNFDNLSDLRVSTISRVTGPNKQAARLNP